MMTYDEIWCLFSHALLSQCGIWYSSHHYFPHHKPTNCWDVMVEVVFRTNVNNAMMKDIHTESERDIKPTGFIAVGSADCIPCMDPIGFPTRLFRDRWISHAAMVARDRHSQHQSSMVARLLSSLRMFHVGINVPWLSMNHHQPLSIANQQINPNSELALICPPLTSITIRCMTSI